MNMSMKSYCSKNAEKGALVACWRAQVSMLRVFELSHKGRAEVLQVGFGSGRAGFLPGYRNGPF